MTDRDRTDDARRDEEHGEDPHREEERRINPPGLGPIERSRPPEGGEPDPEKTTDWEEEPHEE